MGNGNRSDVSVVLASSNSIDTIQDCLDALQKQTRVDLIREIIVADCSTDGTREVVSKNFSEVTILPFNKETLIPELWSAGILASKGDIVATTTTSFIPSDNWIEKIVDELSNNYDGVGGAIENHPSGTLSDWGLYFCRYSNYMLPFQGKMLNDIPADNAAYRRDVLMKYENMIKNGFWENFINAEMVKEGYKLYLSPNIVNVHKKSFGPWTFAKQRFLHGVRYGCERSKNFSSVKKIFFALASPIIPLLYLKRIGARIWNKKRHIGKFILSLPILLFFLISWSVGEGCGYLCIKDVEKRNR